MCLQAPEDHALYISVQNHTKYILRLTKTSFINRKCANLCSSDSSKNFWQMTKSVSNNLTFSSFPPLLNPDGSTAVTSISKTELFTQTFSADSTLDNSWHSPPPHTPTNSTLLVIRILNNDVFYTLSDLNPQKT